MSICRLSTYNAQKHLLLNSFNSQCNEEALVFLPRENWLASAKHLPLLGFGFGVWGLEFLSRPTENLTVSGPHCSLTARYIQVSGGQVYYIS